MKRRIRAAIVGFGAVAEEYYLPAIRENKKLELKYVVEKNDYKYILLQINSLDSRFRGNDMEVKSRNRVDTIKLLDYKLLFGKADVAFVTLPNYLHAPVAIDLMNHGIHVFCEKPLGLNTEEVIKMIKTAKDNRVKLGVGMVRRYFEINQKVKDIIQKGKLGKVLSFDYQEGSPFSWPVKSGYLYDRKKSGGGVLIDTGSHVLDLLNWFFGKPKLIIYTDDYSGGVEANCNISLRYGNIKGRIELSRERQLSNQLIIYFETGKIILPAGGISQLEIYHGSKKEIVKSADRFIDGFRRETTEFVDLITDDSEKYVKGEEVMNSLGLIEECYRQSKSKGKSKSKNKVLVTGASGFIGGRIVERLCTEYGIKSICLVNNYQNAVRISKFNIELVKGDILDRKLINNLTQKAEYVIHCAFGNTSDTKLNRKITVEGTKIITEACLKNNVKQLIYFSTMSVYGYPLPKEVVEHTPYHEVVGDYYHNDKVEAENIVSDLKNKGLSATILQPTIVYGPYSKSWTIGVIQQIKDSSLVLVDRGMGFCNHLYIDNLVDAVFLALGNNKAIGEKFIISDEATSTWNDFYSYYLKMMGKSDISDISEKTTADAIALPLIMVRKIKKYLYDKNVYRGNLAFVKKYLLPAVNKSLAMNGFDMNRQLFFRDRAVFDISKAKRILGYNPKIGLREGMNITEKWLRYFNYF